MSQGVLHNIGELAVCAPEAADDDAGLIEDAALAWEDGRIAWSGPEGELPEHFRDWPRHDAQGGLAIPGLIDCHTHTVFGGWRGDEFGMRCAGESYQAIAAAGGGIVSTVSATRAASNEELLSKAKRSCDEMLALGVTTLEGKSGYGLNPEHEYRQLEVYRELRGQISQELAVTFLGAHTFAPEYKERRDDYVALLCEEMIPHVAEQGLAEFCDIFIEQNAYTPQQGERILQAAKQHGLGIKIHADQLSDSGAAEMAARYEAVSAEHLEYASEDGLRAMAAAGTVAVSLPLASLYLNEPFVNGRRYRELGVKVAVATDFNPGSAPSYHLPLALTLACVRQQMSPQAALRGATINAAQALARQDRLGSLSNGYEADFAVIDAPSLNHWLYHFRPNACRATFKGGQPAWRSH